jgi:TonB family protein
LQFEDESGMSYPVRGEMIGMLLHDHRSLRLAVLNACEGARSSRQDPFSGVAQSLLQQRVPAVIAMQFEISDVAAKVFAREFYRAIAEGNPVDAAICESRKALFREEYGQEWATPVLYMRSQEGLLFDLQPGGAVIVPGSGEREPAKTDSRQRQAVEAPRVAREAEAQRVAVREAEAEPWAAERKRLGRETAQRERPAAASLDAEVQAAALTGSEQASAEASKRGAPATSLGGVAVAGAQLPSPIPKPPTRMHLPIWQVLLLTLPIAGLVLALSWHHLRPHSDEEHAEHGVPAAQSSVAPISPNVTPGADKTLAASPAKAMDKTPAPAPSAKTKAASTHASSDEAKVADKSASASASAAAAAATLAASPASTTPAPSAAASQPAASTAPAPVAPKRVRVDAAQQSAKLVDRVNPTYPMLARQTQISGVVKVGIVVGKDGKVLWATPISGDALLLQSAMDAVKQWRYQPTLANGEPVEVESTVEVDYKLNPAPAAAKPAPCTLGKVDFQDQGTMLIGSVPYTYSGTSDLQTLAVRGVPLNADKQPIAGASIAQSTLKTASGTASFSIQGHPSMGKAATDGEYVLVAIVVKSSSDVVCGEAVPYRHKW